MFASAWHEIYCKDHTSDSPTYTWNNILNQKVGCIIPTRRRNIEYKMFPSVTVQVQHKEPGNMHP